METGRSIGELVVLMLLVLTGCQSANPPGEEASVKKSEPPLVVASWEEVQQMVAAHEGKVVVLDLWSTWCLPCMKEFPHLVEIHQDFPDHVACISVSLNYTGAEDETPEDMREQVMPFLTAKKAFFQNVISRDPDNVVMERISLASIPAVMVFGRDGTLLKRFDNDQGLYGEGFTYPDNILPLVKEAIAAR